mgnify:FL=1
MATVKNYIQLDGSQGITNPFPNHDKGFINRTYKNPYEKSTRENIAFNANFNSGTGLGGGYARSQAQTQLKEMTLSMSSKEEAKKNTGANRSAVGSLGMASGIGAAGNAQAGLVGSVNTEVQNDDMMLPYQKV